MSTKTKTRNSYTGEFKVKVVFEAIRGEKNLKDLAVEYGIHPNQIKNWKSMLKKKAEEFFEDKRYKNSG